MSRAGSIKKAADGTWFFVVDTAAEGAPRKQVRRRGFRTKAEAQAELNRVLHGVQEGTFVEPSKVTVAEWFEVWLAGLHVAGLEESTIDSYQRNLANHVLPRIGPGRLQALTAVDLDRLYARLLSEGRLPRRQKDEGPSEPPSGLSAKTVRYISTIIGKALADAEKKGLVARNVNRAATAPSPKAARAPEMKFWTPEELHQFLTAVADDELYPLLRLTAMTGLRRGEVVGLLWRDVDLDAGRVLVRRQIGAVQHQPVVKEYPKSDHGRRVVDIDPTTVAALKAQKARQAARRLALGAGWRDTGLMFTDVAGDALHPERLSQTFDRRLVKRGQVPRIRFHDLRHTHCAHLIAADVNVKAVSRRMGHHSVSFTLDRYGHLLPDADAQAALAVSALVDVL